MALGNAGIGLEGGGVYSGRAHFLVCDVAAAQAALEAEGFSSVTVTRAVIVPLDADRPGALGRMTDRLSTAGVELRAQYSDHDNRKVLIGDAEAIRAALGGDQT